MKFYFKLHLFIFSFYFIFVLSLHIMLILSISLTNMPNLASLLVIIILKKVIVFLALPLKLSMFLEMSFFMRQIFPFEIYLIYMFLLLSHCPLNITHIRFCTQDSTEADISPNGFSIDFISPMSILVTHPPRARRPPPHLKDFHCATITHATLASSTTSTQTCTHYPLYQYLSYAHSYAAHCYFLFVISSTDEPNWCS